MQIYFPEGILQCLGVDGLIINLIHHYGLLLNEDDQSDEDEDERNSMADTPKRCIFN